MILACLAPAANRPAGRPATAPASAPASRATTEEYPSKALKDACTKAAEELRAKLDKGFTFAISPPFVMAGNMSAASLGLSLLCFMAKLLALSGAVVLVETTNAKLRLFRVPDLLSAAFVLGTIALLSTFLFQ